MIRHDRATVVEVGRARRESDGREVGFIAIDTGAPGRVLRLTEDETGTADTFKIGDVVDVEIAITVELVAPVERAEAPAAEVAP